MAESTKKMIREIRAMGWSVTYAGNNHLCCRHPDATRPVYASASPSSSFAMTQLKGELRRALRDGRAARKV
jgi:predicted RNA binding protein YcfA (HicA-like mRNA interferase family)